jgi:hypothetical protein
LYYVFIFLFAAFLKFCFFVLHFIFFTINNRIDFFADAFPDFGDNISQFGFLRIKDEVSWEKNISPLGKKKVQRECEGVLLHFSVF